MLNKCLREEKHVDRSIDGYVSTEHGETEELCVFFVSNMFSQCFWLTCSVKYSERFGVEITVIQGHNESHVKRL